MGTQALVFMLNGGSSYGLSIHLLRVIYGLMCANHINNEKTTS